MQTFWAILAGLFLGIFLEGIKPLQIHVFKLIWRGIDKGAARIEAEAANTITELDDFFLDYCRENLDKLTAILDRPSLSDQEKETAQAIAATNYRLDILLEKIRDV